ncbi:MAG: DUF4139 domain-containing protein [Myxococcales bacterium]|nr:DUF4139 domain-containing protein [Myxococcales bacterium]
MRSLVLGAASLLLVGCGAQVTTTHVKSETQLGRVVVYRNGVAYFERYAEVSGDTLKVAVPSDKVDDFLKSLTVVDARTGKPTPVAYPSSPTSGTIDMKIQLDGPAPHKLRLSYVTEAPSWKPTYRAVVRPDGKVDLQAWAIVDNTSGEDWTNVKLGVGSSSAMAFRFDLRSLRMVQRETLKTDNLFAVAPPVGGATHGANVPGLQGQARVLGEMTDDVIARNEVVTRDAERRVPATAQHHTPKTDSTGTGTVSKGGLAGAAAGAGGAAYGRAAGAAQPSTSPPPPPADPYRSQLDSLARQSNAAQNSTIVIEGFASNADKDKMSASLDRANRVREQLLRQGADPSKVVAVGKGEEAQRPTGGVRIVDQPLALAPEIASAQPQGAKGAAPSSGEPVGTSHFESGTPMTVGKGTSAMVSMLAGATEGEVVYLYDPETARGNGQFPFKALRFRNPTDSVLESGPVSVFGEGRFVGEGLAEPIPSRAVAFVPFALDRQVMVERKDIERDEVARVLTVSRGVFHTEVKHTKRSTFTLYNRMNDKATVYVRHTVAPGYSLGEAPPSPEKLGAANLFKVELKAGEKREITIEEHTPVFKTTDIRTPQGLEQIKVYVSQAANKGPLADRLAEIVKLNTDMVKIDEEIATRREQMQEYRARMDELHAQIVTLRAVKTAGPLLGHLEKKMQEVSERLSKATIDVVALEEKKMVARVRLQDAVAELSLAGEKAEKAEKK